MLCIHENFTVAKDEFRDGFRPWWCGKEVDVMTVLEVIQERMKDGTKYRDSRCETETPSFQSCLASNLVCTTLARACKRKTWFLGRKEEIVKRDARLGITCVCF